MTEININPESEFGYLLSKIAERLERIATGIEEINRYNDFRRTGVYK